MDAARVGKDGGARLVRCVSRRCVQRVMRLYSVRLCWSVVLPLCQRQNGFGFLMGTSL